LGDALIAMLTTYLIDRDGMIQLGSAGYGSGAEAHL
jgi:hypothetical protein